MYEPPDFLLRLPLGELSGYWCQIHCSCGRCACLPFRMLATEFPKRTLGQLLSGLTCKGCQVKPKKVALVSTSTDGMAGMMDSPRSWRIEVYAPELRSF